MVRRHRPVAPSLPPHPAPRALVPRHIAPHYLRQRQRRLNRSAVLPNQALHILRPILCPLPLPLFSHFRALLCGLRPLLRLPPMPLILLSRVTPPAESLFCG